MHRICVLRPAIALLALAGLALAGCSHKDPSVDQPPPPGPNARPDPVNADKAKHLPGAAKPAGGGGAPGSAS